MQSSPLKCNYQHPYGRAHICRREKWATNNSSLNENAGSSWIAMMNQRNTEISTIIQFNYTPVVVL